jgi:CRP-like cAMP-binding protein
MIPIDACEPYFEYVRKYIELDSETMQLTASQISEITFPQKHIIFSEGGVCNKVYFVVSGTARSYYTDFSGMTVTWSFHFNNNRSLIRNVFVTDYRAFLTGKPTSIAVETLSEVSALIFTKEAVNYLMEKSLKYEIWMRKLNESAYVSMYDRAFSLLTMSATERYHKLLNEEPHLMQMFSNYYIASYLGIAPQSLSRIRGQH